MILKSVWHAWRGSEEVRAIAPSSGPLMHLIGADARNISTALPPSLQPNNTTWQTKQKDQTTMTKLNDKTVLRQLRIDIDTALTAIREKYDLTKLHAGNIRFEGDGSEAKIQLHAVARLEAGQKTREQRDFETYAEFYGIARDAFAKVFSMNGRDVRIVGMDMKKRKYPIVVSEVPSGKRMLTTAEVVARHFPCTRCGPSGILSKQSANEAAAAAGLAR